MRSSAWCRTPELHDVKREIPPQFFRPYRQDENIGSINFYADGERSVPFMASITRAMARWMRTCRSKTSGR
jgi:hypothetical protein